MNPFVNNEMATEFRFTSKNNVLPTKRVEKPPLSS